MQDAADSTAYSSAVIHARGMNILVLLNMIMALLIALLMLISLLLQIVTAAKYFCLAAAWLNPGLLAVVPYLDRAQSTLEKV